MGWHRIPGRCPKPYMALLAGLWLAGSILPAGPVWGQILPGPRLLLRTEFQDIPPKFVMNPDGRPGGISWQIMRLVESRSQVRFAWTPASLPLARVLEHLAEGSADIQFGLQKTPEREAAMVFGAVLYLVRPVVLIRGDDQADFASLADLARAGPVRGRILTIGGTAIAQALARQPGIWLDAGHADVTLALQALLDGKGRAFIYHDLSINHVIQQPRFVGRFRLVDLDLGPDPDLGPTPQYLVYSRQVPRAIVRYLDGVIARARRSGELDRITVPYLY